MKSRHRTVQRKSTWRILLGAGLLGAALWLGGSGRVQAGDPAGFPGYVETGLAWLASAQHENGGWGAGSHADQQLRDPHQVCTDPATTAFGAMAFLRAGSTPTHGPYAGTLRRATEHLVTVVEEYPAEGPRITDLTGTQPQVKLGQLIDTSMAVLYFSRLMPHLEEGALRTRVDRTLDKCLAKLQGAQTANGAWDQAGWAGVLQSSLGCSALEFARAAGKKVDKRMLSDARTYNRGNYDMETGAVRTIDGAGVELYAYSSAQRAVAGQARAAEELIKEAKREGRLERDADVSRENLARVGVPATKATTLAEAYRQNATQTGRLDDESLLDGFGSTGGEEYLSYLFTSEALVITGGEPWEKWNRTMQERLPSIQHEDGSWSGRHCIVGPAFCTAAVLQCLTAGEDADLLARIGIDDVEENRD